MARTTEQAAAQQALRAFARARRTSEAARDETGTAWKQLWTPLAQLGLFAVAVPDHRGGLGGTLADLAAMLEVAGAELIPGPIVGTAVGALLCSRSTVDQQLLDDAMAGDRPAAVAMGPTDAVLRTDGDELLISGDFCGVHGACDRSMLILPATSGRDTVWVIIGPDQPGLELTALPAIDFTVPCASVVCRDVPVTAVIEAPEGLVEDLYVTVSGAMCAGIARRCLDIATDYAKVREQFGEKIGHFQSIKHLCVEMLCRAEHPGALAFDAAEVTDDERPLAAAATGALVLDAAVENAKDCIQVLGAIGFTWEHDAHLFLKRAMALRFRAGDSRQWRRHTAARARTHAERRLPVPLGEVEANRSVVRHDIAAIAPMPDPDRQRALADSGYLAPHFPRPYGQGASTAEQLLISQEMQRAGIDRPDLIIGWWAAPTILEAGTPEQLERFIMPTLRGDMVWCQLFSEPGAGSDLASLRTAAGRVAGGWRLSGQKIWPTHARTAHWAICLARTDRSAQKHRGITYFLLDMATPGIDVRPVRAMTGELMLNEVFLDDVFVPDDCVLGQVNDGWRLARSTLANERVEMNTGTLGAPTRKLLGLSAETDDDAIAEQVGCLVAQAIANSLLAHRALLEGIGGAQPGVEASLHKLQGVRQRQQVAELILTLAGIDGQCIGADSHEFLITRALSIAGGSAQVLATLVGERMLGLPR
jgi:alkylation response protein AidB-like acyl-CoA dehydrogenase